MGLFVWINFCCTLEEAHSKLCFADIYVWHEILSSILILMNFDSNHIWINTVLDGDQVLEVVFNSFFVFLSWILQYLDDQLIATICWIIFGNIWEYFLIITNWNKITNISIKAWEMYDFEGTSKQSLFLCCTCCIQILLWTIFLVWHWLIFCLHF